MALRHGVIRGFHNKAATTTKTEPHAHTHTHERARATGNGGYPISPNNTDFSYTIKHRVKMLKLILYCLCSVSQIHCNNSCIG